MPHKRKISIETTAVHKFLLPTHHYPSFFKTNKLITFSLFQVAGEWTLHRGEFFLDLRRLIGRSRARNEIPLRRLLQSGANVTLSSDYDVSALSPFQGMQHAVTRNDQAVELKVITNN